MSVCQTSNCEEKMMVGICLLVHGRLADLEWMRRCCPFFTVNFGICKAVCWRLAFFRGGENTNGLHRMTWSRLDRWQYRLTKDPQASPPHLKFAFKGFTLLLFGSLAFCTET